MSNSINSDLIATANAIVSAVSTQSITVELQYSPDFLLPQLSAEKIVVVPYGIEKKLLARSGAKEVTHIIEIAILKRGKNLDIPTLIEEAESIGEKLLGKTFSGKICLGIEFDPVYDADMLRSSNQFTSVIVARLRGLA